ncbi:M28 family metallopeptidase [Bacillus cereus]|uniref:M28 family metallopeptidase n=1 Tax=Bacillus cereus TaxID=1396 RepID=UPI00069814E8|nr:M28 family metallopeptidase [Bacillus cereus]
MSPNIQSIIMWLDQSCGIMRLTEENKLTGIDFFPETEKSINSLKAHGVKIILFLPNLISESTEAIMEFIPQFDEIVIYENEKNIKKHLEQYSRNTGSTIFVSSDRVLRNVAANMGFLSVPHPCIAQHILQKKPYYLVQVFGSKEKVRNIHEGIPYFFYEIENDKWCLLSILTDKIIQKIIKQGLKVQKLDIDLSREDPLFLEIDVWDEEIMETLKKKYNNLLSIEDRKILVALGPTESNEEVHLHGKTHAHPQLLLPSPEIFYSNTFNDDLINIDSNNFTRNSNTGTESFLFENISASTAESFQAIVDRYSGKLDLDTQGPIKSRHVLHADNARVVQTLQNDLASQGFCPTLHRFSFSGISLNNVIADLPGTRSSSFTANVQEGLRELFLKYPKPAPVENWLPAVKEILGEEMFGSQLSIDMNPFALRKSIEESFGLRSWFPWWLESCPLPAQESKLIIVGCHLDSTAANDSIYNPTSDSAPGADDDASGIAATLLIAKRLAEFQGRLTHTVRFCFFNAEESGLVGSKVYASMLKSTGAPIKAVICMDMIGFNRSKNQLFEIHAGYNDPSIRDASLSIAQVIKKHTAGVSSLSSPQIYQGTITGSNPDRTVFDGAINRSDHASFHQQGYPAVVISEDFFENLRIPPEPPSDPNPNYHRRTDTSIDASYGSAITNVIANAVLELAIE